MKHWHKYISQISIWMERLIAMILVIAVAFCSVVLIGKVFQFDQVDHELYLQEILSYAFNIVIVIEFIRMLVKHSMNTVFEVLIFALARGLIVDHENAVQMAVSIASIGVLMVCRKFLFLASDLDEE